MNANQFNPVSGSVFSGRNEASALEAKAEHGYTSNKWITYFQAKTLDILDGATLKDKAVGMVRFNKVEGKSSQIWYNVFNTDLFPNLPEEMANCKTPKKVAKKAAKAAPKKVAKKATKTEASVAKATETQSVAIPVQGEPGCFLIKDANGTYNKITL